MIKIISLTAFALSAFALNSILCRMALSGNEADAAGFTLIRIVAGAVTLAAISYLFNSKAKQKGRGNWVSAFFLFAYAICFSFAYLSLTTATGALILFSSVQMTMIIIALLKGERPGIVEWFGIAAALGGLVYLVFPGLASPPFLSSALMAAAGMSWGVYTLRGRSSDDPLGDTTGNFIRAVPFVLIIAIVFLPHFHLSSRGAVLAILSGALASGVGYTAWYAVLKHHTSTRAAVMQLAVPVIAAAGGVVFLSESAGRRLVIAALLILGGIGLTIFGKKRA